jgi:BACON domain-containing protein
MTTTVEGRARRRAALVALALAAMTICLVVAVPGEAQITFADGQFSAVLNYPDRAALLADGWTFVARTAAGDGRDTEQTSGRVVSFDQALHPGVIRIPADAGDLWGGLNNTRNTLFRDLPADWTSIRLGIPVFAPSANWQTACLLAYENDDSYLAVCRDFVNGQIFEAWHETGGTPASMDVVADTATANIVLRIDRNPATEALDAFFSVNGGATWTALGGVVKALTNPRLGILVGANGSTTVFPPADLGFVHIVVTGAPEPPVLAVSASASGPSRIEFTYPDRAALLAGGWDFLARTAGGGTRDAEQRSGRVVSFDQVAHPGVIRIPTDAGDLWGNDNATRNTLFRDLPADWQRIQLRVAGFAPDANYQGVCLLAYQDDDNYVAVCRDFVNGQAMEWWRETGGGPLSLVIVPSVAIRNFHLRLDRNPSTNILTAFVSTDDGVTWTQLAGSASMTLTNPRLGIFVGANTSATSFPTADLSFVEITSGGALTAAALAVSPTSLSFTGTQNGPNPATQAISVVNTSGGPMSWTASDNQPWLSVSPASGSAPGSITVSVTTSGLAPGTYNGTVTVTAAGATNSPRTVAVALTVTGPVLTVSPANLTFSANQGGTNPAGQTIAISNTGGGTLSWTASDNQPWLSVSPTSGSAPASPTVSASIAGLAPGTYNGTITVTAPGATGSPKTIPVTFLLASPAQTAQFNFNYANRAALLAAGWDFMARLSNGTLRNTEQTTGLVVDYDQTAHPGTIRIPADQGTPWGANNNTRNTLFRTLPVDWESLRLKVSSFAPVGLYQSACLLAYQDDDNYVTLCRDFVGAQLVEWWHETSGGPSVLGSLSITATTNVVLRLDRDRATNVMTTFVSTNGGGTWTQFPGSLTKTLTNARLGVLVGGNVSASIVAADLGFVEVRRATSPEPPPEPSPAGAIATGPAGLAFTRIAGGATPAPQKILVTNAGPGTLNWSVRSNQSWLSATPSTGTMPGGLTVSVAPGTLAPGRYDGTITMTASGAANSPYQIPVAMTIVSLNDRRLLTAAVLVNRANPSGYNTNPATPGEFQRYPERYFEHLQFPYEVIDVSTTPPPSGLSDRQVIIAGHRGLDLTQAWRDAIAVAVNQGTGFINLDWDPAIGAQSHIKTIFGATGSQAGAPGQTVTVPATVVTDGIAPHYIAGLQRRFIGDPAGDIVYKFHVDAQNVFQTVRSTVLTEASGSVIARVGNDPLIVATAHGAGRAVHIGTLDYFKADRFGFLQGVDDLFWRSVVWAARKPFAVRGYPRLWAVQMDDTTPDWGFRVRDLFDPTLTGSVQPDGIGGPWKVTGYLYALLLNPGGPERASVIADINAGQLHVSPHALEAAAYGDLYWNREPRELTDAEWLGNIDRYARWRQGLGGADTIPSISRSVVPHYWDLSDNTGADLWNQFGFRYLTTIQKPGFQRGTDYQGQERLRARPFWLYEIPRKVTLDEDQPFFFADDITVGSRAGLPAQSFFMFTTQVKGIGEHRPDVGWPDAVNETGSWTVEQSLGQFQRTTWRLWSSFAPVQIFTHDAQNYNQSSVTDRRSVIQLLSSWLTAEGVRHRFMDELGDYVHARVKSRLTRSELDGGKLTLEFTGNAATADGGLIATELRLYLGDDEGSAVRIPGFTGGRLVTTPVGGP